MQTSIEQPAETPAEHLSKSSVDSIDDGAKSMSASKLKRSDWFIVFAITLLIALRSWSIANEHSATWDTIYHLDRAVSFAHGTLDTQTQLNDPPMGEVIAFVPYLIAKTFVSEPPLDAMLQWIAIWKSLLLFPALLAAFCWARDLYNREAGWLVVALIALEPTLAAMTAYATLDSLAISAILPAAYLGFRYAQRPTWRGLFLLAISTAFALVCKHTAIALLPIGGLQAINAFISRRRRTERYPIGAHIVVGSVVGLLALWTFTGFDFSPGSRIHPGLEDAPGFRFPADSLPAGVYFRSFSDASLHAAIGHNGRV